MTHWRSHFHTRCLWFLTFLLTLFSPSLTAQATATSSSSNANVGLVGFIFPSEELVEGNFVHFVGVKRTNGSSGAVRCNISIVTSNDVHDAEEGKDYLLLSSFVAFEDGDPDPKAVVLRFFNDQKLETVSYVRLSIACLPEEANGLILQHTLKISDDRDGGIIKLPRNIIPMQEDLLFFPPAESERCVLSVERAGGSSGTAKILVHWHTTPVCAEDDEWPAISEDALFKVDWSYLEGTGSVSWDDGESGVKCAVEKYWLQNFSSTNGSNASAVVVYSDGLVETAEGFCGYITADVGSAAIIPEPSGRLPFAMLIRDRGKTGGGEHRCIKGAECPLNLTLSIAVAFLHQAGNWTFVQAAGHGVQCLPCSIGINQSSYQNLPLHQFRVEGQRFEWAAADLGTSLSNETPGDRSVCMCRDGDPDNATHQIATLVLAGPEGDNTASCFKNQHSCAVRLREIRTTGGQNHLRIMPSCEDYELTPPGFVEGAVAVADETSFWYEMSGTDKMRLEAAGIYKLCWCHSFSPSDCTQLSDFNVEAGSFIYAGPYEVVSLREVRISQVLKVEVSGIGLSSDDEAMLLVTCGMGQPILRAGKIQERFFNFGVLGSHGNEVAAGSYQLCWCQPSLGRSCNSTEEFNVAFGSIRVRCHWNYAELDTGECRRCHLLFEVPEEEDSVCQIDAGSFALVILWWFVSTLLFLAIVTALRCRLWTLPKRPGERPGTFSPTLVGTPRPIRDVSQTGGKLLIATNGYHNLIKFPVSRWSTIPVTLAGTAHPLLDGVQFHVRVRDGRTLEVLCLDRSPVTFRADSSMGQVEVSFGRALLHSALHGLNLKVPLLGQTVILAGCSLAIGRFLEPPGLQGVAVVAAGAFVAVFLFLIWLQFVRTSSPLTHSLKMYASNISEKGMTKKTKKGPERAVAVQEVLDLWDNFQHLVRDRNMYYMDANIVKPLTMPLKLSYAELVGPQDAMWFVSHWWGTEFRVYCEALSRHAKAFREDEVTDWKRTTTYWICTFSNNQHNISEELGQSHQESSFYQALHEGTVKGTCMILDEKAMPLTRSWCLFEILQTIFLKKQVIRFQGLFFCTETGVLNRGNSTVEMSIQIGHRMAHLRLEDAEATTEQDKRMIHDLVIGEMESFDHINRVLKKCIGEALTECEKSVSKQFSDLYEELDFVTDSPQRAGADFVTDSPQRAGADFVTDSPQRAGADFVTDSPQRAGAIRSSL